MIEAILTTMTSITREDLTQGSNVLDHLITLLDTDSLDIIISQMMIEFQMLWSHLEDIQHKWDSAIKYRELSTLLPIK
jgi:hypothetical protein